MEYSGAGGKLIHEKNQKQKISWHCPFKQKSAVEEYGRSLTRCQVPMVNDDISVGLLPIISPWSWPDHNWSPPPPHTHNNNRLEDIIVPDFPTAAERRCGTQQAGTEWISCRAFFITGNLPPLPYFSLFQGVNIGKNEDLYLLICYLSLLLVIISSFSLSLMLSCVCG